MTDEILNDMGVPGESEESEEVGGVEVEESLPEDDEVKQKRAAARTRKQKQRNREARERFNADVTVKEPEIRQILGDRGVKNVNVLNTVLRYAAATAEHAGLSGLNLHAWLYGVSRNKECREKRTQLKLPLNPDGDAFGTRSECLRMSELRALYEYCVFGYEILGTQHTFESWLDLRDRARKDLWWMVKELCHKSFFVERVHGPIFKEFCIQKNFDNVYYEGFTLEDVHAAIGRQTDIKERVCLFPRGAGKSSCDALEQVSWLISCPDVRSAILSGESDNATLFLKEIKTYFSVLEGAELTDFQRTFVEFCIYGVDCTSEVALSCPARIHAGQKDPSLFVNSCHATLSSRHNDLGVFDDCVTDRNSNTPETRAKLKAKLDNAMNLTDEWGIRYWWATRYAPDDYYNGIISAVEEGSQCFLYQKPAWTLKPHVDPDTPLKQLKFEDVDILFWEKAGSPEKAFQHLRAKLLRSQSDFECQQLLMPSGDPLSNRVLFTDELLRSCLISPSAAAKLTGDIYIMLDTAYSNSKYADMSCAAVVRIYPDAATGKWVCVVIDMFCDRYKPEELCNQICMLWKKYPTAKAFLGEKVNGVEYLQLSINQIADRHQMVPPAINWKPKDTQANAKFVRVKLTHALMTQQRLLFVQGPLTELLFEQYIKYIGAKSGKTKKDDGPDCVSLACKNFLPIGDIPQGAELQKMQEDAAQVARRQAQYNAMFGGADTYRPPADSPLQDERTGFNRYLPHYAADRFRR